VWDPLPRTEERLKKGLAANKIAIAVRVLMAPLSVAGEAKAPVAQKPDALAVPRILADLVKKEMDHVGRYEDAMYKTFNNMSADPPEKRQAVYSTIQMVVPMDGGKPMLDFAGGPELQWIPSLRALKFSADSYKKLLDDLMQNLPRKGQGKMANQAYLGIPFGSDLSSTISHKITLDDAGFTVGKSLFVYTQDSMLVHFLRSNYGPKVVGCGTGYPMLNPVELNGKEFDAIYIPKSLKIAPSGTLKAIMDNVKKLLFDNMDIKCHGRLIVHITPMVFYDRTYQKFLWNNKGDLDYETVSKPAVVEYCKETTPLSYGTKTRHEALSRPAWVTVSQDWTPPLKVDVTHLQEQFISQMLEDTETLLVSNPGHYLKKLKKRTLLDADWGILRDALGNSKYHSLYMREVAILKAKAEPTWSTKLAELPGAVDTNRVVSITKLEHVYAPVRVSIDSWRGTLLYSEFLPDVSVVSPLMSLATYMRHGLRIIWRPQPLCTDSYVINRIISHAGANNINWSDKYLEVLGEDVRNEWDNLNLTKMESVIGVSKGAAVVAKDYAVVDGKKGDDDTDIHAFLNRPGGF